MTKFETALKAYTQKELSVTALLSLTENLLNRKPSEANDLLSQLDLFNKHEKLTLDVYTKLQQSIVKHQERTALISTANEKTKVVTHVVRNKNRASESPSSKQLSLDDEATVVRPMGHEATRIIAKPSPTANENITTVAAQTYTALSRSKHDLYEVDTRQQQLLTPGTVLKNRFILENIIGTGGMSVVFKARDLRKEEAQDKNPFIAIKVLGDEFKRHPDSLKVLQRETKKAQSLAHPNIVTVYDFDRDENTIYMTMECLEGETLDKVIKRAPNGMALKKVLPLIEGMARALAYAHKKNIIHSDFKPGNVYYTKDHVVKVLDFGIARAKKNPDFTGEDTTGFDPGKLGALTPPYASCEMLEHGDPDPRDDIYALACITYELLTGHHPFQKIRADKARQSMLKPSKIQCLNRKQWNTLSQALAFNRDDRISDVLKFLGNFKPRRTRSQILALSLTFSLSLAGSYGVYNYFKPPEPTIELSKEQISQIANDLDIAELYMELEQLALPPGDSAFDMYQKVLDINPLNRQALDGMSTIADNYERQARLACQKGDDDRCVSLVDTGLRVSPSHEGLKRLKKMINKQPSKIKP